MNVSAVFLLQKGGTAQNVCETVPWCVKKKPQLNQTPLTNLSRKKVQFCLSLFPAIFERLRNILHESSIDKRVQYMIEVMFAIRKDGFKDHPVVPDGLDLVDEDDQFTHMLPLEDEYTPEDILSKTRLMTLCRIMCVYYFPNLCFFYSVRCV